LKVSADTLVPFETGKKVKAFAPAGILRKKNYLDSP
jgi:hypothetical protein